MSEDEIKTEKPDKIVDIVGRILEFNRQNQERQGLKILTPDQVFSRLTITLDNKTTIIFFVSFKKINQINL